MSEREITTHKVNGVNDGLRIIIHDEPGSGGANHDYCVTRASDAELVSRVRFQKGPIAEAGVNGTTHEVLLSIVAHRLEAFQAGPYACGANEVALRSVRKALEALKARTEERIARGVEGTAKIAIAFVTALTLLSSSAWGQDVKQQVVITQNHADGSSVDYKTASTDPAVWGGIVATAVAQNRQGDTFQAVAGEFVFTAPLPLHGVVLTGAGMDATYFRNNGIHSDKVGGAFQFGNTTLDGISFESKALPDYEDDRCLSLDLVTERTPQNANMPLVPKGTTITTVIRNCRVGAGAWGIYGWNGELIWNLTMENDEVLAGCQCLTGQGSGNDSAQNFSVAKCTFILDPARSKCSQSQTVRNVNYGGSLAITLRAGKHAFSDVTIKVKGSPICTWASCITDTYENGPRDTMKLIVQNLSCSIEPNGTAPEKCHDIRLQNDKVRAAAKFSGKLVGSGEFDSLRMWAAPTSK